MLYCLRLQIHPTGRQAKAPGSAPHGSQGSPAHSSMAQRIVRSLSRSRERSRRTASCPLRVVLRPTHRSKARTRSCRKHSPNLRDAYCAPIELGSRAVRRSMSRPTTSAGDLAQIVWRAPEVIKVMHHKPNSVQGTNADQAFGELRSDNVLEYFSYSPFFDRRSNNGAMNTPSHYDGG